MGWKIVILALLATGQALPPKHQKKSFSIFSLVSFPNNECTVMSDNSMKGNCLSEEECSDQGGVPDGNCASGFGVCCMHSLSACGGTISKNISYISNPSYPTAFTEVSKTCTYTIKSVSEGICQLRLDFDKLVLENPAATGVCADFFTTTSPTGHNPPVWCGKMTGQHMYIEVGSQSTAGTVAITTSATAGSRSWKIKVQQIECESVWKAPTDCLQYHTGTSGQFQSINWDGTATPIQSQLYMICIRQEEGHCSIAYRPYIQGGLDPFQIIDGASAKRTRTCAEGNIQIRTDNSDQNILDIFCGKNFNAVQSDVVDSVVTSNTVPFGVYVWNANADQMGGANPAAHGFTLQYNQLACGISNTN